MTAILMAALLGTQAGLLLALGSVAGEPASSVCFWSSGFVAACAFVEWLHYRKGLRS